MLITKTLKNCKVIKKWQPPISISIPPFSRLSPLSSKIFASTQVTQFLEGPNPPPPTPFNKRGVVSNYESFQTVAIIFWGFQDS